MFFNHTQGGVYEDLNETTSYVFPEGAFIDLNGVQLDISGLKIVSHGGLFDRLTIRALAQAVSKVPSLNFNRFNTSMIIDDVPYPELAYFREKEMPFLKAVEFRQLQQTILTKKTEPSVQMLHRAMVDFIVLWGRTKNEKIKQQIDAILQNNAHFPKSISLLWDGSLREAEHNGVRVRHTVHVMLNYKNVHNCTLIIDNTFSLLQMLDSSFIDNIKNKNNCNIENAYEFFDQEKPNRVSLYEPNTRREMALDLERSIQETYLEIYSKMLEQLNKIPISFQKIYIDSSAYNQKFSYECVPFSFQNKIDWVEKRNPEATESTQEMRARIRAEHAILIYLLNGSETIPRCKESEWVEYGIAYTEGQWYPSYPQMRQEMDLKICSLPHVLLQQLFLAIEIDGELSLADSFKHMLFLALLKERNFSECEDPAYPAEASLSPATAHDLEKIMAPSLKSDQLNHRFFMNKVVRDNLHACNLDYFLSPDILLDESENSEKKRVAV